MIDPLLAVAASWLVFGAGLAWRAPKCPACWRRGVGRDRNRQGSRCRHCRSELVRQLDGRFVLREAGAPIVLPEARVDT